MIKFINKPVNVIKKWLYYRKLRSVHDSNRLNNLNDYDKIDEIVSRYRN